jgi:hypothetical protein
MYTAAGHPSYMCRVPKFNLQDIDASLGTGPHPAFIVNGIEKSELWIGQHMGQVRDGNLISLPGLNPRPYPSSGITFDDAFSKAAANGPGWHLMTAAEWSAIALWCWKNNTIPRGNNNYGRDVECPWETGARVDGGTPGDPTAAQHLTGSGPATWRHNWQASGIADLNGGMWEWNSGLRLMDGEIQILPNNDAADSTKDQSRNSALWKAILASDGSLVAPGTDGTLKYDSTNAVQEGSGGAPILSDTIVNRTGTAGDDNNSQGQNSAAFQSLTAKAAMNVPAIAKALLLYPFTTPLGSDIIYTRNYGERLPLAGGHFNYGASAGVFARNLHYSRSVVHNAVAARPAYVL